MPLETRVTTTQGKMGGRLKEFGKTPECTSSWPELDPQTENLVRENPFAFMVAVALPSGSCSSTSSRQCSPEPRAAGAGVPGSPTSPPAYASSPVSSSRSS